MRGFPFVLGTDIIRISRLDPIQRSAVFIKLARRILRPDEIPGGKSKPTHLRDSESFRALHEWLTVVQQPPPLSPSTDVNDAKTFEMEAQNAARWLAGRWAAKEAAMKAWGAGLVSLKDMKIGADPDAPYVEGSSRPVKVECRPSYDDVSRYLGRDWDIATEGRERFCQDGRLSISHDGDYCVATVIAEPLKEELMTIFRQRTNFVRGMQANQWRSTDNENHGARDDSNARDGQSAGKVQANERKAVEGANVEAVDSAASGEQPPARRRLPKGWKPVIKEDGGGGGGESPANNRPWYEGRS